MNRGEEKRELSTRMSESKGRKRYLTMSEGDRYGERERVRKSEYRGTFFGGAAKTNNGTGFHVPAPKWGTRHTAHAPPRLGTQSSIGLL